MHVSYFYVSSLCQNKIFGPVFLLVCFLTTTPSSRSIFESSIPLLMKMHATSPPPPLWCPFILHSIHLWAPEIVFHAINHFSSESTYHNQANLTFSVTTMLTRSHSTNPPLAAIEWLTKDSPCPSRWGWCDKQQATAGKARQMRKDVQRT